MTQIVNPNFIGFVGQDEAINKLNFKTKMAKIDSGRVRPTLFTGPKGVGKTELAKRFAKTLTKGDGSPRNGFLIDSSSVKRQNFFETTYAQIVKTGGAVVFFDEAHDLDDKFVTTMLSVLNTDANPHRTVHFNGQNYEFDLRETCFLFATTESDKLFKPLRDRLDQVNFVPYTQAELGKIMVERMTTEVNFAPNVMVQICSVLKGNARSAVNMALDLSGFCLINNIDDFNLGHWAKFRKELGILPYGLTRDEVEILRYLERGPATLRGLEAFTGQSRSAIQRDLEVNLIRLDMIKITNERQITPHGLATLQRIDSGVW